MGKIAGNARTLTGLQTAIIQFLILICHVHTTKHDKFTLNMFTTFLRKLVLN